MGPKDAWTSSSCKLYQFPLDCLVAVDACSGTKRWATAGLRSLAQSDPQYTRERGHQPHDWLEQICKSLGFVANLRARPYIHFSQHRRLPEKITERHFSSVFVLPVLPRFSCMPHCLVGLGLAGEEAVLICDVSRKRSQPFATVRDLARRWGRPGICDL